MPDDPKKLIQQLLAPEDLAYVLEHAIVDRDRCTIGLQYFVGNLTAQAIAKDSGRSVQEVEKHILSLSLVLIRAVTQLRVEKA